MSLTYTIDGMEVSAEPNDTILSSAAKAVCGGRIKRSAASTRSAAGTAAARFNIFFACFCAIILSLLLHEDRKRSILLNSDRY